MRQVLDIFELLTPGPPSQTGVEWKLVNASTNTPLRVQAEAVSLEPSVDVSVVAHTQKQNFAKSLREITRGQIPSDPEFRVQIAKRILKRNLNGVGATEIDLELGEPITVTPRVAKEAIQVLAKKPPGTIYDFPSPRDEIGSIEGSLQDVGTHYNYPAVRVEARQKVLVWCRLSPELQNEFQDKTTFNDVWRHRRVVVHGHIKHDEDGEIEYVLADDIQPIEAKEISVEEIKDTQFTGGLSITEYLERFREGTLG